MLNKEFGRRVARRDAFLIRQRIEKASYADLSNWWWLFKTSAYSFWLGLKAPFIFTEAGWEYYQIMKGK